MAGQNGAERLYSIGETAVILNLSVSTLRHYDKLGLVKPAFTDEKTGYRYYSRDQFHYIDRIKYLQKFGFNLSEIADIMQDGKSEHLIPYLENKKRDYDRELEEIHKKKELLEWYIQYFTYNRGQESEKEIYETILPERYVVAAPYENEKPPETSDVKLLQVKNLPGLKDLHYKRQWGCILDYRHMQKREFYPRHSFTLLAEKPDFRSRHFKVLPAGVYLCFKARLFANDFGAWEAVEGYFANPNIAPGAVIAMEFENNFHEYVSCLYEVQIEILHK